MIFDNANSSLFIFNTSSNNNNDCCPTHHATSAIALTPTTAIIAFVMPVLVPLALLNNGLVVLVFARSTEVARRLSPTVRVYYIGMAFSAMNSVLPLHLTYFMGLFPRPFRTSI